MENNIYLYIGIIYFVVASILITLALILINKHNKKKYNEALTILERDKNLIISASILSELNKVESLINNKDLEKTYNIWKVNLNKSKIRKFLKLQMNLLKLKNCLKQKTTNLLRKN